MKKGFSGISWRSLLTTSIAAATMMAGIQAASAADKVKVGALRFTSHAAGFIALEKGYFKEEGIDAEFTFFQAAQPIAVSMASGDTDFGIAGMTGGFVNLAAKDAIKAIGGVLREKKGVDGMAILASNKAYEAGLTTPAKMAGHSVALTQIGSTFHYMSSIIADANGFKLSDLKLTPLQKVGSMIGAIKSGQVDVMIMVPHIAKPLAKAGAVKHIGWLNEFTDDYQISVMAASSKTINENPDVVKRFIKAYAKGIEEFDRVMLNQDKYPAEVEELVKIIHKYVYTDRPYEKAAPGIKAGSMFLNEGVKLNVSDLDRQLKWMQSEGLVASDIKIDQVVNKTFTENY
jgi:NitT/TauT family transport system substrate-binding protein